GCAGRSPGRAAAATLGSGVQPLRGKDTGTCPSPRSSPPGKVFGPRPEGAVNMCGIVGFTGRREASPVLLEGLRRLEYRGYDSAGLVTGTGNELHLRKNAGRLAELGKLVAAHPAPGCYGISHTRWATHGGATDRNAHPHL